MKIIHQSRCDDDSFLCSKALKEFLGPDGAAVLTSLLSYGLVHAATGGEPIRAEHLPNLDHWVDFFRRVQLPYYEESREYLASPDGREEFAGTTEVYPYLQGSLQAMRQ